MKKIALIVCLPLYAFRLGIENISAEVIQLLQSGRLGLVTNQTGVDQKGRGTADVLRSKGVSVSAIYVPEHGLDGTIKAGQDVLSQGVPMAVNNAVSTPVISLYAHGAGRIDRHAFDGVDMLAIDLQDVGMRHYTYISTLYMVMEECARLKKSVFVFDRPNLLGGVMEGPICASQLKSFIGIAEIPLRHGMTIGELAQFFNAKSLTHKVDLKVIPLGEYQRNMSFSKLLSHLSPNIKTLASAYGYSFLGLVGEIAPFHVGVGTADAFQVIMLPQSLHVSAQAWHVLQEELMSFGIDAKAHSVYHETKKKDYEGLKLSFNDINVVSSFKALMAVLAWTRKQNVKVSFLRTFDKSVGTSAVQEWYQGNESVESFLQLMKQQAQEFLNTNQSILLYPDQPRVVRLAKESEFLYV